MPSRGEVLVAIMNSKRDMDLARVQNWYRISVASVEKLLKEQWPPNWLAFYQTKVFGSKAYTINYYARVQNIRKVYRYKLFERIDAERQEQIKMKSSTTNIPCW